MADKTLTAASVVPSAGATLIKQYNFGASITAGQVVYLDANLTWQLADANASALTAAFVGIAVNGGAAGQPAVVATSDPAFTHGLAAVAAGDVLILSGTAGAIAPVADAASGWYVGVVGVAISATQMVLGNLRATVAK